MQKNALTFGVREVTRNFLRKSTFPLSFELMTLFLPVFGYCRFNSCTHRRLRISDGEELLACAWRNVSKQTRRKKNEKILVRVMFIVRFTVNGVWHQYLARSLIDVRLWVPGSR